MTLASSSPFDSPRIDPSYLNTSFDTQVMRAAIRSAANFVSASAWNGFVTGQAGAFAGVDLNSDSSVDAYARSQGTTIWHPTGTARMGRCGDTSSVVDPDLRVKGTRGLRVIDASVLVRIDCWLERRRLSTDVKCSQPYIPAAHPQAVVYAFAERAASLIKLGTHAC